MKTSAIRKAFIDYFVQNGHTEVASSSLVPGNDPTLLFTNAGMVQFKEIFLGLEKSDYTRATSSQRCVRAGGKHNDLENVGYTARHHTFFEMLGNFSFGDYFKREAIQFAWRFLTEVLQLPAEKLWVTVYQDDDEAADIWLKELKVDPKRFSRCGEADNFWAMGATGPCGPCSEIFYDHGPEIAGGPPGSPEQEGDRYVEIWNLVFMQYVRSAEGELQPLPKPSVDTGMGLERIAAVMQGVHSNYDIDLFQRLITAAADILQLKEKTDNSLKVIADHIRSCVFLILDGVVPANEGRGYVLRRIIRRAVRHGNKLGMTQPFFYRLVETLAEVMGDAYPELIKNQQRIADQLFKEEEQFAKTLDQGMKILEQDLAALKEKKIPGETIFKLYDTYGFPVDLTADIARERDLEMDMPGFEAAMAKQRSQSQAASQFRAEFSEVSGVESETDFVGYDSLAHDASVVMLWREGKQLVELREGDKGAVVLDRTPFYAESGGQVGDQGVLTFPEGRFVVHDTIRHGQAHLHYGVLESGLLQVGNLVTAEVDTVKRWATMLNHSATHLLHAALRAVLGEHVLQKGSLVAPDRLRFDFSNGQGLTVAELEQIEDLVNQQIRQNNSVETDIMTPDEAKASGAMALFGEKYDEKVRVLSMGGFSKELCGGTHVGRTGDIGLFKIVAETGIAAGVRRIEAITGDAAMQWLHRLEQQASRAAKLVKGQASDWIDKLEQLTQKQRQLEKQVEKLQQKLAGSVGTDLTSQAVTVKDVRVLAVKLEGIDTKALRTTLDQVKDKLGTAVVVLVAVNDARINVVAGISKDCIGRVPAPKELAVAICGKAGGRDDMAQGGGEKPSDLDDRLASVVKMVEEALA